MGPVAMVWWLSLVQVNGTSMWGLSHDQAVNMIKQTGQAVTLHTAKMTLREMGQ